MQILGFNDWDPMQRAHSNFHNKKINGKRKMIPNFKLCK